MLRRTTIIHYVIRPTKTAKITEVTVHIGQLQPYTGDVTACWKRKPAIRGNGPVPGAPARKRGPLPTDCLWQRWPAATQLKRICPDHLEKTE